MIDLHRLSLEIAELTPDRPGEYCVPYWAAYTHLVRAKSPDAQRRLMRLLADGAMLDAASLLFNLAYPELSFQVVGGRAGHPSIGTALDEHYRQISGPHLAKSAGHAVLLALVQVALVKQRQMEARSNAR